MATNAGANAGAKGLSTRRFGYVRTVAISLTSR